MLMLCFLPATIYKLYICLFYFPFFLQHPRTWEAQFQSGIKVLHFKPKDIKSLGNTNSLAWFDSNILQTIALIAVREGVVQLGAIHKVLSLN